MAYSYQSSSSFTEYANFDQQQLQQLQQQQQQQQQERGSPLSSTSSTPNTYSGEFLPINNPPMHIYATENNAHLNLSRGYYPSTSSMEGYPSTAASPYQEQVGIPSPTLPITPPAEGLSIPHLPDIYEVHFKRTMDLFIRGYTESFKIGDFVKVEADRGFDLGVIATIMIPGSSNYPYHSIPRRRVLSLANDDEKAFLLAKIEEEYRALDICRDLAARRQMKINVLDAELQFDRRKLTFLFTSEKHTDFRELVRDLFSIFKTRIWMQKINPAQAASLEQDCKNSHFPTLPKMHLAMKSFDKNPSESYHFDSSPTLSHKSPLSSPSRGSPKLRGEILEMTQSSSHHGHNIPPPLPPHLVNNSNNNNAMRSSSFTSTGSASTFEEDDEDDSYQMERARRVGGVRGVRGEGDSLTLAYTGGAGSRAGIRGLGPLQFPSHSHGYGLQSLPPPPQQLQPQHSPVYSRNALSLPHGLDSQSVYSTSNNFDAPLRSNSGLSERAYYELNNDGGRSVSLPTALPSHYWSNHNPLELPESSTTTTTNSSNSTTSIDPGYLRNLNQYAGISISARQLKNYELQQQRYLTEKSHHLPTPHESYYDPNLPPDSIFSHQIPPIPDILIDDIQISLPNNVENTGDQVSFYSSPTYSPNTRQNSGKKNDSSTRRSFTEGPIDVTIQTDRSH